MFWFVLCVNYVHIHIHTFYLRPRARAVNADPSEMKPETKSVHSFIRNEELEMKSVLWRFIRRGLIQPTTDD